MAICAHPTGGEPLYGPHVGKRRGSKGGREALADVALGCCRHLARDLRGRPNWQSGPSLLSADRPKAEGAVKAAAKRFARAFYENRCDRKVDVALRDGVISYQWVELANVYYDTGRGPTVTWFDGAASAAGYDPKHIRVAYASASARRGRGQPPPPRHRQMPCRSTPRRPMKWKAMMLRLRLRRPSRVGSGPPAALPTPPSQAWLACARLRLATWNAHALETHDAALRRRRRAAARRLAEAHDIVFLQEVHGDEHSMLALSDAFSVSHLMNGSPGPTAAAAGCACMYLVP